MPTCEALQLRMIGLRAVAERCQYLAEQNENDDPSLLSLCERIAREIGLAEDFLAAHVKESRDAYLVKAKSHMDTVDFLAGSILDRFAPVPALV